jgi:hypothetical protein
MLDIGVVSRAQEEFGHATLLYSGQLGTALFLQLKTGVWQGCATRMGEIIGFIFGGAKSLRIDTLGLEATFACFSSLPGTRKSGHLGTDVTTR